jgi:hypothetical protein
MAPYDGCYGVLDHATFLATYDRLTTRRSIRQALARGKHVVLMEVIEGNQVNVLPACAMPYIWRTVWCLKPQEVPHGA